MKSIKTGKRVAKSRKRGIRDDFFPLKSDHGVLYIETGIIKRDEVYEFS